VFQVTASDGALSATTSLTAVISNVNRPPTAVVGPDVTAAERSNVTATVAVFDPDGDAVTIGWAQRSGPAVDLGGATGASFTFVAPDVTPEQVASGTNRVVLRVTASDGLLSTSVDSTLTVDNLNRPPLVTAAAEPSVDARALVTLTGTATDPDGEAMTLEWTQVEGPPVALSSTQGGERHLHRSRRVGHHPVDLRTDRSRC
jgi:hypothetical protein